MTANTVPDRTRRRRVWLLAVCGTALAAAHAWAGQLPHASAAAGATPLATFDAAWQAIRETYVDDRRTDEDWERLYREFRTRAAGAADDDALRPILRDLLAALGRSHFELVPGTLHERMNLTGGVADTGDVGLELTPIQGELVVSRVERGGPADERGIRPGWVLESVDALEIDDLSPANAADDPHAAFRLWATATALLRGPVGASTELRLRDADDRPVVATLTRRRQEGSPVKFGHLPTFFARLEQRDLRGPGGSRVVYIRFNIWMTPIAAALDRAIAAAKDADGVILDLRQNPGGVLTMLMGVSGYFLKDPVSLGRVRTRESELELIANPRYVGPDGTPLSPFEGQLAILVDASSYSASEIFAGGMQAIGRARVFGSRSPGGALPAMLKRLPNGDILEYAIGDFVTPRGNRIEGHGVTPDEIVPLTRGALLAGEDPPLSAALAWAARGRGSSNAQAPGPAIR
ncbi:MAG TPA: S41 family peptidase [Vicinamibacterales bacterium]|nr:S41 family peptidase [Vicinamibacterales bacterium]